MGKFNSRRWGKVKISNHLIQKGIKNEYIQNAITQISDEKYNKSLTDLINYKSNQISDSNIFNKNSKIAKYLYQKGYESELIWNKIKIISKDYD
jgi:regulatory protein